MLNASKYLRSGGCFEAHIEEPEQNSKIKAAKNGLTNRLHTKIMDSTCIKSNENVA